MSCWLYKILGYKIRVKNDLSIHSSFLIIWSRNKGLGCLQQYRVIIDASMHCWCSRISGSLLGSLLGDVNSAPELLGWTGFLGSFTDGHMMSSSTIKTIGLWLATSCNMPYFQANKTPATSSRYSYSSWFSDGTTGDELVIFLAKFTLQSTLFTACIKCRWGKELLESWIRSNLVRVRISWTNCFHCIAPFSCLQLRFQCI